MVEKLSSSSENFKNYKNELDELKNLFNNVGKESSNDTESREKENDLPDEEYLKECEKLLLNNGINVNDFSEEEFEQSLNDVRNILLEPNRDDAGWGVLLVRGAIIAAIAYLYKIKDKTWEDLASKKNTYPWIFSVQLILRELGYDIPKPDGFFGTQIEEAIKKFQADNKLKVDGAPGRETINKIIVRMIKHRKERKERK